MLPILSFDRFPFAVHPHHARLDGAPLIVGKRPVDASSVATLAKANVSKTDRRTDQREDEPVEVVTLIPMGAARLRISTFPTVTTGPDGHEWVAPALPPPPRYKASASHCHDTDTDTVDALSDGAEPDHSNDHSIPRMTWWPRQGTCEWVQYDFVPPRRVSSVSVYWFDDTPRGGCALPAAWRVRYWDGDEWRAVANAQSGPIAKDVFNSTTFDAVVTQSLRLEVDLQPDRSGGILEWTVEESDEP